MNHRNRKQKIAPDSCVAASPVAVLRFRNPVRGAVRELIRHERNGLLFAPGDAASLAAQLLRLASEPSLLDALRWGIGPARPAEREAEDLEALYLDRLGCRPVSECPADSRLP